MGEAAVAVLATVVFAWSIGTPSAWWDEAVTREVVARPVSELFALAGHVDLVHLTYYLLAHGVFRLAGSPEDSGHVYLLLRSASALAAVLTVVTMVRIGRALRAPRVGVTAALLLVVSPLFSRYAQEARPYALATLAATLATLVLLSARASAAGRRWVVYGLLITVTGLLNEIALLVVIVHAAIVLGGVADPPRERVAGPRDGTALPREGTVVPGEGVIVPREGTAALREGSAGELRRRWLVAVGLPLLALLPFLALTTRQSGQVSWLTSPAPTALLRYFQVEWEAPRVVGVVVAVLVVLALAASRLRRAGWAGPHRAALMIGLIWGAGLPLVLWLLAQWQPAFVIRYLIFCLPGAALLLASAATVTGRRSGPWVPAALVVLLAATGWHAQGIYRHPVRGHAENLRGVARVVGEESRPGDGVLFVPYSRRVVELGYPEYFRRTVDITADPASTTPGDLFGAEIGPERLEAAAARFDRVWLISGDPRDGDVLTPTDRAGKELLAREYVQISRLVSTTFSVSLYERR